MDEAMNDLAFIATGICGKPIPNQNGAPLRLVTPWKYGFKGIKLIVKIEFTARQPQNTWNVMAGASAGRRARLRALQSPSARKRAAYRCRCDSPPTRRCAP